MAFSFSFYRKIIPAEKASECPSRVYLHQGAETLGELARLKNETISIYTMVSQLLSHSTL
jgi:hypothetical protein